MWPRIFDEARLETALTRWSLIFAALLIVTPTILVRLDYTYTNNITAGFAVGITLACVVSLLPFLAVGVAIAPHDTAVTRHGWDTSTDSIW